MSNNKEEINDNDKEITELKEQIKQLKDEIKNLKELLNNNNNTFQLKGKLKSLLSNTKIEKEILRIKENLKINCLKGYYFWDNNYTQLIGPFKSEKNAKTAMNIFRNLD